MRNYSGWKDAMQTPVIIPLWITVLKMPFLQIKRELAKPSQTGSLYFFCSWVQKIELLPSHPAPSKLWLCLPWVCTILTNFGSLGFHSDSNMGKEILDSASKISATQPWNCDGMPRQWELLLIFNIFYRSMCLSRNTWRIFLLASSFLISPSCSVSGFCPPSFSPLNKHCSSYLPPQLIFYLSINLKLGDLGPWFIQEFHKALSLQKSDPSPSQRVPVSIALVIIWILTHWW